MRFKFNEDIIIEKYPDWCKDEIDKLIHEILIIDNLHQGNGFTKSVLSNLIHKRLYVKFLNGMLLDDKIDNLKKIGIIKVNPEIVETEKITLNNMEI